MHELQFKKPYVPPTVEELEALAYARQMDKLSPSYARALGLCPIHWDDLVQNVDATWGCPSCIREDFHEERP